MFISSPATRLTKNAAAAIRTIKKTAKTIPRGKDKEPITERRIGLEIGSKEKALELLARIFGMLTGKRAWITAPWRSALGLRRMDVIVLDASGLNSVD